MTAASLGALAGSFLADCAVVFWVAVDTLEVGAAVTEGPAGKALGVDVAGAVDVTVEGVTDGFTEPVVSVEVAAKAAPIPRDNKTDNALSLIVFMMCPLFESYSPKSWSTYSTVMGLKVLTQIINYLCQPQRVLSVTLIIIIFLIINSIHSNAARSKRVKLSHKSGKGLRIKRLTHLPC